uniref:Uncharacterized protein n=1 Tax=viral metagenome TaxID=1070528 RepID=A0A2V0RAZ2_9ZZZZ
MSRNLVKRSITDGGTKFSTADSRYVKHSAPTSSGLLSKVAKEEKRIVKEAEKERQRIERERRILEEEKRKRELEERERKRKLEEEEREREEEEREREAFEAAAAAAAAEQARFDAIAEANNSIDADGTTSTDDNVSTSDKLNPFSKASREGINEFHKDLFSGGGATNFQDAMTYYEGIVYKLGGVLTIPGMPTAAGAHLAMLGADLSHELRTASADDWNPTTDNRTEDEKNFNTRLGDRILRTMDVVGAILDGTPGEISGIPGFDKVSQDDDNQDFFGGVGRRFETVGNRFGNDFTSMEGGKFGFNALSKFESESQRIKNLHGIRVIESDRYYTVMYHPSSGVTYIEWKPTEDIRNIKQRNRMSSVGREWSEDFVAAMGIRIPAWSKRVRYIKGKYGMESDSVKHYGYSRGGGLATHLGGTGYGTGYFSSYMPDKESKSKLSGDRLHDLLINPISYSLMLRNVLRNS